MAKTNAENSALGEVPPFKLRLRKAHRLIDQMLAPPPKPDQYGYTRPDNRPHIDIRVSAGQRRTALAVMDRLFKALESRDFKIEIGTDYQHRGAYAVHGHYERVALSIAETYRKVEHVPTAKELREKEQWPNITRIPKWDDVPTGKLTLSPGGPVDLSSEEAVQQVIEKAVADVEQQVSEARQRREAEAKRQHEEYLKHKATQEEKDRVAALGKASHGLQEYKLLMEYIEEVRRFGTVPQDQRREGQTLEEWLRWAEWQARQIHPLG